MPAKEVRRRDRFQQFILAAAKEAAEQAGFTVTDANRHRSGAILGSAVGGVESYYEQAQVLFETKDPRRITPFGIPMLMVNGGSDHVSIEFGTMGPSYVPVSACATGADCIGHAFDLIRMGRLDQVIWGALTRSSPVVEKPRLFQSELRLSTVWGLVRVRMLRRIQRRGPSIKTVLG